MKLLSVHTKQDDGSRKIDPEKIIELCIKLAGIAGIIVGVWASKQAGQNTQKIQSQQHFLKTDRGAAYVESVEKNAANQRSK